jgi:nucleoside-diphosphate-sugar epimerase
MILVTGATGLVGSHLLYALLQKHTSVVALCRKDSHRAFVEEVFAHYSADGESLAKRIEWRVADLLDVGALEDAFEGISHVYHCAAMVSFTAGDAGHMMEVNQLGTANVVNVALHKGVKHLVYVSSVAALGRSGENGIISEETEWTESKHNSAYAKSKYNAELEVWRGMQEGLSASIVNPGIIFGPGDWSEGSPALVKKIADGFPYYTLGTNGFVDVRDVVDVMQLLMERKISEERFVLVSENLSYKKVFEFIAEGLEQEPPQKEAQAWKGAVLWRLEKLRTTLFGGKPLITEETARSAASTYYYENAKVRKMLSFEFRPMSEAIQQTAALYKKQHRTP